MPSDPKRPEAAASDPLEVLIAKLHERYKEKFSIYGELADELNMVRAVHAAQVEARARLAEAKLPYGTVTPWGKVVKYAPAYWCVPEDSNVAEALDAGMLETVTRANLAANSKPLPAHPGRRERD